MSDGVASSAFNGQHPPVGWSQPQLQLPFIPPQIFQDALMLSKPVELSDEPTLIRAIAECRERRESYKDALNKLHGKDGHSASLWKDYYLDHKDKIDAAVQESATPTPPPIRKNTIKKPAIASFKPDSSASESEASRSPSPVPSVSRSRKPRKKKKRDETEIIQQPGSSGGRRQTINSLTAHTLVLSNSRLPPPNTEIRIPPPPSREPIPPTLVIPHNRGGHKFTTEDKKYFLEFIQWRLQEDPSLNRKDLCEELGEKAPHHNYTSWNSYWSNHHDLPDKILAQARNEDSDNDSAKPRDKIQPLPRYKEDSSDSELSAAASGSEDEWQEEDEDSVEIATEDETQMGAAGAPFNSADFAALARHIASYPNWEYSSNAAKFGAFVDKYPERSAKAWGEFYRRNDKLIDRMVRKLQTKMKPTPKERKLPSVKRKSDLEEVDVGSAKRNRTEY
ncbi:hypothetical protein MIND_00470200 [Mycena indigotica]|uniref:Uncharacterized protein n=1 Tax=Mycena indigotica TaxID=2126181 RepID=A0A8H6SV71_9AGAR|nr:uncharacterized protein MIND_00470200 [Mycena indigotica]KAF7306785.1 hypothetical protein MIND_00470200 [Mycena indigotica]